MSASNDNGHPDDVPPPDPASEAEREELLKQTRVPPELQEWFLQQFPPEEVLRAIEDVQANGGYSLDDILAEFYESETKDREHA